MTPLSRLRICLGPDTASAVLQAYLTRDPHTTIPTIYREMLEEATVPCTKCAQGRALPAQSIDEDPICPICANKLDLSKSCLGYLEDCGNPILPEYDLCSDCLRVRLDTQSPRIPK